MMDVMPFGDGQVLIQLFRVSAIPNGIEFGRYYEATCDITFKDGNADRRKCIAYRPTNRRNVAGVRQVDWIWLVLKTDLNSKQLSDATVEVAEYGRELEEEEAAARAGRSLAKPKACTHERGS